MATSPSAEDTAASADTSTTDVTQDSSSFDASTTTDIESPDGGGDLQSDYRRPVFERIAANPGCTSSKLSTAFDGEVGLVVAQRIDTPSLPARVHAVTIWSGTPRPGTVRPSIVLGECDAELPVPLVVFAGPPSADGRGVESISAIAEVIAPPDGIDTDQRVQVLVWPPLTVKEGDVVYVGGRYVVEDDKASCFTICADGPEGIVAHVGADGSFEWVGTHGPLDVDVTLEVAAP
ncbi:MAG: hypothetical protein IV100_35020 [Myxococcales bacterium]|nr:hypothetical protein [Myxococcales bacterium]